MAYMEAHAIEEYCRTRYTGASEGQAWNGYATCRCGRGVGWMEGRAVENGCRAEVWVRRHESASPMGPGVDKCGSVYDREQALKSSRSRTVEESDKDFDVSRSRV
ncbi:hypothetical protein BDD12DRAFT_536208 [Trichophaea hybrida]|nr:hypothetical protein BDD12DRAFT_536208 [Trichophaea hybrida]